MKVLRNNFSINALVVFDNLTLELPVSVPEYGKADEFTLLDIPFRKVNRKTFYEGYFKTLRVAIYENRITISNSFAGYFYGHNCIDISYNQLFEVIDSLCELLGCESIDIKVLYLEFGFTLEVCYIPQMIIRRLVMLHNKPPQQTSRKGKIVETLFDFTNHSYKAYDKGLEEKLTNKRKLDGNFLRIEMSSDYGHFKNIAPIRTASDLLNLENILLLFYEFRNMWRNIRKAPILKSKGIDTKTQYEVYAKLNGLYWFDYENTVSEDAYKKAKHRFFNEKLPTIGDHSIFTEIEHQFTNKFIELIGEKNVPDFHTILIGQKGGHSHATKEQLNEA